MTERKRWDKQHHDFQPSSDSNAIESKADPVLTKQLHYIKVLEERNRLKKRLAASKRNDRLHEREEAFVTAFNVPVRSASSTSSSSFASRSTKSATSVLATKVSRKREDSKCSSAPSTTLPFVAKRSEDKGVDSTRGQRAKWHRPQAPMEVAVQHFDGVPQFRLTTHEEREEKDMVEDDEEYLDESFEEFEDDDESKAHSYKELVIEEIADDGDDATLKPASVEPSEKETKFETFARLNSLGDLAKTTKDLFGIIQHLSRTKQRALVDLLQKFQTGHQTEHDVKTLQSSIGDPAIWKEITSVLHPSPHALASPAREIVSKEAKDDAREGSDRSPLTVANQLLEEQLRLEEEYATEMKERLARERAEKQLLLKKAEDRRARMMKQFEDEEREIEQLMEVKRKERFAKLKALQEEARGATATANLVHVDKGRTSESALGVSDVKKRQESRKVDMDGKDATLVCLEKSALTPRDVLSDVQESSKLMAMYSSPTSFSTLNKEAKSYAIQVKFLSTWGTTRAVGLTQICVYDRHGEELLVDLDSLQLYDQSSGRPLPKTNDMVRGLPKLFNGVTQTNREKDMWHGRLGDSDVLLVHFSVPSSPSKLCVWNHNSKTHAACTRDLEVVVCDKLVWTGSLPESFGDPDDNLCTWIDLQGSVRKGGRIAREKERSLSTGKSSFPQIEDDALESQQKDPPRVNDLSTERLTPMWLLDPASTSMDTEALPATSRSTELNGSTSGTNVGRRRQRHSLCGVQSARSDAKDLSTVDRILSKSYSSHDVINYKEENTCDDKEIATPALASLSSWDSLEKFSRTNRSRLDQPRQIEEDMPTKPLHSKESFESLSEASNSRSFASSALLTELRHVPKPSSYAEAMQIHPLDSNFATDSSLKSPREDIPVLPNGKWLQLEILSTWGDVNYVGLNGIEIFDHCGNLVIFQDPAQQIRACPESINVLEEYSNDPRLPRNLVDGVNFTCDDFHMWLAPFTRGQRHVVLIALPAFTSISMVRVWNYNKSRTHTCRGVRDARLVLYDESPRRGEESGKVIFQGEIRQAPGLVGAESLDGASEVILFTQEPLILKAIEANDEVLRTLGREQEREEREAREIVDNVQRSLELRRPRTSDAGSRMVEDSLPEQINDENDALMETESRPWTMATRREAEVRTSVDTWVDEEHTSKKFASTEEWAEDDDLPRGRYLTLQLHSTWGDRNYIGLTQVQVLVGPRGTPISLDMGHLTATPRDLASLGYLGDPRTLDKLIDGETTTCDDTHMWLVPFDAGTVPEVHIQFEIAQSFFGLRLWNYNKSLEDTTRGVRQLVVLLDRVVLSPQETGFLMRKAPGVADFDYGQLLIFSSVKSDSLPYSERVRYPFRSLAYKTPIIRQDYEVPLYPQGFLLKLICWTTWGDPYYLGLNGLELYDFAGARIVERPTILTAVPHSVSEMDNGSGNQQDTRLPENLLSGHDKNTWEAHDAWLAPLASSLGNHHGNIVYLGFDAPIVLSMIKFWNYSKNPERGVKDVEIYLDDLHLFSGTLKKAPNGDGLQGSSRFGKIHKVTEQFGQPVLFSSKQAQVDTEKRNVYYCGIEEQDVLGINEGQVMQESKAMYRKPDPGAEGVISDLKLRPLTAVCRQ